MLPIPLIQHDSLGLVELAYKYKLPLLPIQAIGGAIF